MVEHIDGQSIMYVIFIPQLKCNTSYLFIDI